MVAIVVAGCTGDTGTGDASATPIATSDSVPSPSPGARVRPLVDLGGTAIMGPGTYVLEQFPVPILFDIPDGDEPGWHVGKSSPDAAVVLWYTPPEITWGFAFWNVDNVYVDPCDAAAGELQPPIGPTVDDLVSALSNLPAFQATPPVDVTVGAFRGTYIELTALDSGVDCPQALAWSAGDDSTDLEPGDSRLVNVVDVDGVRIVIVTIEPEKPDPAVQAELQQILDSIRLNPSP
ncbi:MAG: hypothetical protein WEE67_04860 [Chloroflexota bacterium]